MTVLGTVGAVTLVDDVAGVGPLKVTRAKVVGDSSYQSGGSLGLLAALQAAWKEDRTIIAVNGTGDNGDNGMNYTPATKPVSCTVNATTDVVSTGSVAHGFVANDPVVFTPSNSNDADLPDPKIPGGLTAGTVYYVLSSGLTTTAFKVSTTIGGSALDITDTGLGGLLVNRADTLKVRAPSTGSEVSNGDQSANTYTVLVQAY